MEQSTSTFHKNRLHFFGVQICEKRRQITLLIEFGVFYRIFFCCLELVVANCGDFSRKKMMRFWKRKLIVNDNPQRIFSFPLSYVQFRVVVESRIFPNHNGIFLGSPFMHEFSGKPIANPFRVKVFASHESIGSLRPFQNDIRTVSWS